MAETITPNYLGPTLGPPLTPDNGASHLSWESLPSAFNTTKAFVGSLALGEATNADVRDWRGRARALLAVAGALSMEEGLYQDFADRLLNQEQAGAEDSGPRLETDYLTSPFRPAEAASSHSTTQGQPAKEWSTFGRRKDFAGAYPFGYRLRMKGQTDDVPPALFSHKQEPQTSPPPKPYTPTFGVRFQGFSHEAMDDARRILKEVAEEKQIQPSDVLGRADIAREAFMRAHPDRGGNTETAQLLNAVYKEEEKNPRVKAAKEAHRAARAQAAAEQEHSNSIPTPEGTDDNGDSSKPTSPSAAAA